MRARATARASSAGQSQAMPRPGVSRRDRVAGFDGEPRRRDVVELRNVLDPARIGHRRGQRDVQLHQEVRADGDVECLGEVRHLEPRRDAADPRRVDLDDRAGAPLEVFAEVRRRIQRLADGDRDRRVGGELLVAAQVLGRQRLLEPREVERLVGARPAHRLGDGEALVGVDHDLELPADRLAHRGEPGDVLGHRRPPDLDLGAEETVGLRLQRLGDEFVGREVQPAAFGAVDRHARLRAARGLPQRQPRAPAAPVPQRGVDRRQREARDRADRGRVGVEEEVAPDRLDAVGIAADEPGCEMIAQQRDDRRAAGADRVGVARALAAVVAADAHDRRLLAHERLDRVGAQHLRREVDLQDLDGADQRHGGAAAGAGRRYL